MTDRSGNGGAPGQRTIGKPISRSGLGLHTGTDVKATLRPADVGTGLRFRRSDLPDSPEVAGEVAAVTGVEWETVLSDGDAVVRTVEHLLAAVAGMGIDNLEVHLEGPELPALDGSALEWCELIRAAGVIEQDEPAPRLVVKEPFGFELVDSRYSVVPYSGYRISAEIDFENPAIGRQFASLDMDEAAFCEELAPARTFGLDIWADLLSERGLAQGATHENTIIVSASGLAPGTELRYPDEFVRHKIIDLVGDLALVGSRIEAHIFAERPGHRGNIELARRLLALQEEDSGPVLDIQEILEYIPHRFPFLLVDRILEFEAGKRIIGLKNVTINEPFFTGHFPDHPIMPGVLIVEAMAQVGGLLLMNEFENPRDKVVYFLSLDEVKFRRPVVPGDQLVFELEMLQFRGRNCRMKGVGRVDGQAVAEALMMARVVDR